MAVDMFIKIGDIKGESLDDAHKNEIDVLAWSWGMSNSGTTHMGGGGGSGKANIQDLSFTKYIDLSSPKLQKACDVSQHFPEAKLVVRKGGTKPLEYVTITMTECLITSVATGGSGGEDRLTENVSLNFAKVKFEYKLQGKDGASSGGDSYTYDIAANKAS
jgi:type VI secretion system secreted protein Hcp